MSNQIVYLLSNSSLDSYPENRLNKFTNQLPRKLEFESNQIWEVGVKSIGISFKFRNIRLPPPDIPSIVVVRYSNSENEYMDLPHIRGDMHMNCIQHPLQFDLLDKMDPQYQSHFFLEDYFIIISMWKILQKDLKKKILTSI